MMKTPSGWISPIPNNINQHVSMTAGIRLLMEKLFNRVVVYGMI